MKAVIDANIVLAALISTEGNTKELLFSPALELVSPDFLCEELEKYRSHVKEKARYTEGEMDTVLSLILSRIKIISSLEYASERSKAKQISPDPKDTEYFALALKLGCHIWSNDKALKKQDRVKVLSTSELLKLF